jgi:hypothetical protein
MQIIEENEFGIKITDNQLCVVCGKYILKKIFMKHRNKHEKDFNEKNTNNYKYEQ